VNYLNNLTMDDVPNGSSGWPTVKPLQRAISELMDNHFDPAGRLFLDEFDQFLRKRLTA
jgi:hypothetical protein